ncbi:MAG: hypothetical protein RSD94_11235, partial [Acinetobacter sp.]
TKISLHLAVLSAPKMKGENKLETHEEICMPRSGYRYLAGSCSACSCVAGQLLPLSWRYGKQL